MPEALARAWSALVSAAPWLHLGEIAAAMKAMLVSLGGFFVVIYALEAFAGADRRRYLSRGFLNDFVYNVFYRGGIYAFLVYLPIMNRIAPRVSIDLLQALPFPVKVALYWLARDLLAYWVHRAQHAVPQLWEFHKVHHSQERLTFLTTSRFHVVDQLLNHLVPLVPLMVFFGPAPGTWIALHLATEFILFIQHSELTWTYGRAKWAIVSPAFHAVHHSVEPAHHGRNFGMLFSFWDRIFGTALDAELPVRRFGVPGWTEPESFWRQLAAPFRALAGGRRQPAAELRTERAQGEQA